MRKEIINKCVVYYVRDGQSRIRPFPSEAIMDRWVRKFKNDFVNDNDENWIELTVVGVKTMQVHFKGVRVIPYGE